jgi:hypothetical protein
MTRLTICRWHLLIAPAALLASSVAHGSGEIIGPPNDVAGVDNLTFVFGGNQYTYDVLFPSQQSYNAVYGVTPPTFLNNFAGATAAGDELTQVLNGANVTHIDGVTPLPTEDPNGKPNIEEFLNIPYDNGFCPPSPGGNCFQAVIPTYNNIGTPRWTSGGLTPIAVDDDTCVFCAFTLFTDERVNSVPEPATIGLMVLGVAGVGLMRRRRKS